MRVSCRHALLVPPELGRKTPEALGHLSMSAPSLYLYHVPFRLQPLFCWRIDTQGKTLISPSQPAARSTDDGQNGNRVWKGESLASLLGRAKGEGVAARQSGRTHWSDQYATRCPQWHRESRAAIFRIWTKTSDALIPTCASLIWIARKDKGTRHHCHRF